MPLPGEPPWLSRDMNLGVMNAGLSLHHTGGSELMLCCISLLNKTTMKAIHLGKKTTYQEILLLTLEQENISKHIYRSP